MSETDVGRTIILLQGLAGPAPKVHDESNHAHTCKHSGYARMKDELMIV